MAAPGGDEPAALPDDEGEDVRASRAQGHADADLPAPLRDGVAEQAVDAERGEEEREGRERPDEDGVEARLRDGGPTAGRPSSSPR